MYGLVNQAIADLARTLGGDDLWDRVREDADVPGVSFAAMEPYDDVLTARLVAAASTSLDLTPEQVLHAFGRHWVLFTGRQGYGEMLAAMGTTLPEFLRNLDAMHARVTFIMPGLRPPSFAVEELGGSCLRLRYRSHRTGLTAMVGGLLDGLGVLLGIDVTVVETVHHVDPTTRTDASFLVEHRPATAGPAT